MKARIGKLEFEVKDSKDLELLFSFRKKLTIPESYTVEKKEISKATKILPVPAKHYKKRKSNKFMHWSEKELDIVRDNPPKRAQRLLAGRTIHSIYVKRGKLGITTKHVKVPIFLGKKQKIAKKELKPRAIMEKPDFDMFERREDKEEATNLYLAILEHSSRKKKPISIAEVCSLFALNATEARALLLDTWQQQKAIFTWLNILDRSMILTSDSTLEFK